MSTPLQIRITRKNKGGQADDRIWVRPDGPLNLSIKFRDMCDPSSPITTESTLTDTGLVTYISTLVKLLRTDTDPFYSVQFCFPAFPTIMYEMARLHNPEVLHALRNAARITHEAWVAAAEAAEESESEATASDSSSTSISSEEDDSTDEDMPPLIRAEDYREPPEHLLRDLAEYRIHHCTLENERPVRVLRGRTIHLYQS